MKCLNRVEIQEYIDKEVNSADDLKIKDHLNNCEECSSLCNEAMADKNLITSLLAQTVFSEESFSIPELKYPGDKKKSYRFLTIMAAAFLTGIILLFRFDQKPVTFKIPEAEIIMYEYLEGKDLNKIWHDKSQILIIQDEKGNVIHTTVTY
jgi:hypothetical protein